MPNSYREAMEQLNDLRFQIRLLYLNDALKIEVQTNRWIRESNNENKNIRIKNMHRL